MQHASAARPVSRALAGLMLVGQTTLALSPTIGVAIVGRILVGAGRRFDRDRQLRQRVIPTRANNSRR